MHADPRRSEWTWDPSLYRGSAAFYAIGRVAYPPALVDVVVSALALDGSGRLLDVGCGPGSLTLLLAPHVFEAIGVDADPDMLAAGARLADARGVRNVTWRHLRAEELPADLAPVRVVTLAQSFHWMDRPRVAAAARRLLTPGGGLVHVGATTHEGVDTDVALAHPRPPREAIAELVRRFLGPDQRAGQGLRPAPTGGDEDVIYRAAGFQGPERFELPEWTVDRSADEIAASIYSLSFAAPHLFGDRLRDFDAELRGLLGKASVSGTFSERMGSIAIDIWRPGV